MAVAGAPILMMDVVSTAMMSPLPVPIRPAAWIVAPLNARMEPLMTVALPVTVTAEPVPWTCSLPETWIDPVAVSFAPAASASVAGGPNAAVTSTDPAMVAWPVSTTLPLVVRRAAEPVPPIVVYWFRLAVPAIVTALALPGMRAGALRIVVSFQLVAVVQLPPLGPLQL